MYRCLLFTALWDRKKAGWVHEARGELILDVAPQIGSEIWCESRLFRIKRVIHLRHAAQAASVAIQVEPIDQNFEQVLNELASQETSGMGISSNHSGAP